MKWRVKSPPPPQRCGGPGSNPGPRLMAWVEANPARSKAKDRREADGRGRSALPGPQGPGSCQVGRIREMTLPPAMREDRIRGTGRPQPRGPAQAGPLRF